MIKLNLASDKDIYVNLAVVAYIREELYYTPAKEVGTGSIIFFNNERLTAVVKETPKQIITIWNEHLADIERIKYHAVRMNR